MTPSIKNTILALASIILGLIFTICNVSFDALKLHVRVGFKFEDTLEHFRLVGFTIDLC